MKFSAEHTSTLNIFTDGNFPGNKIKPPENETDTRPTKNARQQQQREEAACCAEARQQLSLTRLSLRTQEARWRQLLSAESRLRRRQLSSVLSALVGLERRLRAEQASIRAQLAARDTLIRQQALEIARLRRAARRTKAFSLPADFSSSPTAVVDPPSQSVHDESYEPHSSLKTQADTAAAIQRLEMSTGVLREEQEKLETACGDRSYQMRHEDYTDRDLYKVYNHNPVLECVNQILLRDQDDGDSQEYTNKYLNRDKMNEKERKVKFTYTCSSIEEEQEEEQEEAGNQMETTNGKVPGALGTSMTEKEEKENEEEFDIVKEVEKVAALHKKASEQKLEQMRWAAKEKTPSPPIKAQHSEEKACLMMSSQGLTLVRNVELEEVDRSHDNGTNEKLADTLKKETANSILKEKNLNDLAKECGGPESARKESETRSGGEAALARPAPPPKPPQLGSLLLMRRQGQCQGRARPDDFLLPRQCQRQRQRQILSNGSLAVARAHDDAAAIRVGSSVSSLITGSAGGSIVTELTRGQAQERPVIGDDSLLRSNFEEFRLEEVDVGGRADGDGAEEARAPPSPSPSLSLQLQQQRDSYESFLEATGLSQKAILTPSRLLSNHRSVLKPKDVKHRSRVLRADRSSAPLVRYWVEPFL